MAAIADTDVRVQRVLTPRSHRLRVNVGRQTLLAAWINSDDGR
ncbi:hypothetical protein [Nonomuraea sp. NPDC049784]